MDRQHTYTILHTTAYRTNNTTPHETPPQCCMTDMDDEPALTKADDT